jgi:tRNA(Glu) U13 pseudouridine synthase TruD
MALHGSVCGAHGKVFLPMWGFDVSRSRKETEQGEAESAEDENEKSDDYAEKKFAHESSRGIVAEAEGGKPAGC